MGQRPPKAEFAEFLEATKVARPGAKGRRGAGWAPRAWSGPGLPGRPALVLAGAMAWPAGPGVSARGASTPGYRLASLRDSRGARKSGDQKGDPTGDLSLCRPAPPFIGLPIPAHFCVVTGGRSRVLCHHDDPRKCPYPRASRSADRLGGQSGETKRPAGVGEPRVAGWLLASAWSGQRWLGHA